ncbi:NF-kappa-B inhibitor protein 1 [Biomphalaria glabrata]|nr:NF-kappa-B inhibitor protein 1 [Biomphalaria glabrata]
MGVRAKLKSFIKDDRPVTLQNYVSSHDVKLTKFKFSRQRNIVHYCSEIGSPEMLRVILKLCHKVNIQDKDGNLPLHLALYRGLQEDVLVARETLLDIVTPLLQAYSLGQDVENKYGETGYDLLQKLKKKIKSADAQTKKTVNETPDSEDGEDEKWRKKLAEEAEFEYEEQLTRYDCGEEYEDTSTKETFDQFTERIRNEHAAKATRDRQHIFWRDRKRKLESDDSSEKTKKPHKESEDEKLKAAREQMKKNFKPGVEVKLNRYKSQKENYERKFSYLLGHLAGKTLTFGCIPWPCLDLTILGDILFSDFEDKQGPDYRKYLRSQQVRWHPDKFTQKFKDYMHPDHVTKIMGKVKAISQFLNKLSSDLHDKET